MIAGNILRDEFRVYAYYPFKNYPQFFPYSQTSSTKQLKTNLHCKINYALGSFCHNDSELVEKEMVDFVVGISTW